MKQDWNLRNHITYGEKISWDRYLLVLEKQIILISVTTFELLDSWTNKKNLQIWKVDLIWTDFFNCLVCEKIAQSISLIKIIYRYVFLYYLVDMI